MKIIACSLLVFGAAENRHIAAAIVIEIINNPVPLPLAVLVNDDLPLGGADAWVLIPFAVVQAGDPGRMLHRDRFLKRQGPIGSINHVKYLSRQRFGSECCSQVAAERTVLSAPENLRWPERL
jgi:hypothetical protein